MIRARGTSSLQLRGYFPDGIDAVVDEINLPAAIQFLLDGRLDQLVVPAGDHRLDRHTILGRSLDHAHVAQSHHGHVQRARNRCRRHGQHVDFFAHLLEPFFMADAKTLFFVHHQQSKIGKLHVLREQPVGADQYVDLARFHLLQDFFLLLRIPKAADHLDCTGNAANRCLNVS